MVRFNHYFLSLLQDGPTTVINDPVEGPKTFTFDYSFWSHDGFKANSEGYSVPVNNRYADQKSVYNCLGKQVLDNAWEGYHCCLFAYGQTGSGKSYSMVSKIQKTILMFCYLTTTFQIGYGANKGIVPIACNEIFDRINKLKSPNNTFEVSFSIVEIYNEKTQDLMVLP